MISKIQRQMKQHHRMTLVEAIERIALDSTRLQGHSDGKDRHLNFMGLLADIQAYIQEDHLAGVTAVSEAISNAQDAHSGSL